MKTSDWKPNTRVYIARIDSMSQNRIADKAEGFTTDLAPARIANILKIEVKLDNGCTRLFAPHLVQFMPAPGVSK
jgi:hypothetical protein